MLVTLDPVYIGAGSSTINNHDEARPKKKSGGLHDLVIDF